MARLPAITSKEQLPAADQRIAEAVIKSRGGIHGPFTMLLHAPKLAEHLVNTGAYIRFEGKLDHRVRVLAAMVAAREFEAVYVWGAQSGSARRQGVPESTITAIRENHSRGVPAEDAQIIEFTRTLLRKHRVDAGTFEALQKRDRQLAYSVILRDQEIDALSQLTQENFGAMLHVIRYPARKLDAVIAEAPALDFPASQEIGPRVSPLGRALTEPLIAIEWTEADELATEPPHRFLKRSRPAVVAQRGGHGEGLHGRVGVFEADEPLADARYLAQLADPAGTITPISWVV